MVGFLLSKYGIYLIFIPLFLQDIKGGITILISYPRCEQVVVPFILFILFPQKCLLFRLVASQYMNASYRVFCHVMEQWMLDSSKTGAFLDFLWAPFHQLVKYSFLINFCYTFINQLVFVCLFCPLPSSHTHTKSFLR